MTKPSYQELEQSVRRLEEQSAVVDHSCRILRQEIGTLGETIAFQKSLLDLLPQIVCYIDKNNTYRLANKTYERYFQVDAAAIIGRHPLEVMGEQAYRAVADRHQAALAGETQDYETTLVLPDGDRRRFRANYHPYIVNGKVAGFLAVVTDITEQAAAEEQLRERELQYRNLVDNLPGTAYQFRLAPHGEFSFTYINANSDRILGLPAADIIADASCLFDRIPEPDRTQAYAAIHHSAATLTTYELEHRLLKPGGETVWIAATASPRQTVDGSVVWDGIGLDVTARHQAELAVKRSYEYLKCQKEIAQLFLASKDEALFNDILSLLRRVFSAEFGFIGHLDEQGDLQCPSMIQEIWQRCSIPEKSITFPKETWGGSWGDALRQRRTIRKNSGLIPPEGHVGLRNALLVPLLVAGELVGMIALANKEDGFTDEDQDRLESLAQFIAPVMQIRLDKEDAYHKLRATVTKLEHTNIALNVMIENRDAEKDKVFKQVQENFNKLVFPYYEKIKQYQGRTDFLTILEIIKENTRESLLPFERSAASTYHLLSPREVEVADLVKAGKTSKQIAGILGLSPRSVFFHRDNMRKKLNLHGSHINLQTFLRNARS